MKLQKFGTVTENESGAICLSGFRVDPEGLPIYDEDHLLETCLDLVIERLLALKKARTDARQLLWLTNLPVDLMHNA